MIAGTIDGDAIARAKGWAKISSSESFKSQIDYDNRIATIATDIGNRISTSRVALMIDGAVDGRTIVEAKRLVKSTDCVGVKNDIDIYRRITTIDIRFGEQHCAACFTIVKRFTTVIKSIFFTNSSTDLPRIRLGVDGDKHIENRIAFKTTSHRKEIETDRLSFMISIAIYIYGISTTDGIAEFADWFCFWIIEVDINRRIATVYGTTGKADGISRIELAISRIIDTIGLPEAKRVGIGKNAQAASDLYGHGAGGEG